MTLNTDYRFRLGKMSKYIYTQDIQTFKSLILDNKWRKFCGTSHETVAIYLHLLPRTFGLSVNNDMVWDVTCRSTERTLQLMLANNMEIKDVLRIFSLQTQVSPVTTLYQRHLIYRVVLNENIIHHTPFVAFTSRIDHASWFERSRAVDTFIEGGYSVAGIIHNSSY